MFEDALWKSSPKFDKMSKFTLFQIVFFIPLILIVAVPFLIYFKLGIVAIILAVLAVVMLFVFSIISRKFKWENPKLIFALMEDGFYFSTIKANSYFSAEYDNIAGYAFENEKDNRATVVIVFKNIEDAGMMGKLKYVKMFNVENFSTLQQILSQHNIECLNKLEK